MIRAPNNLRILCDICLVINWNNFHNHIFYTHSSILVQFQVLYTQLSLTHTHMEIWAHNFAQIFLIRIENCLGQKYTCVCVSLFVHSLFRLLLFFFMIISCPPILCVQCIFICSVDVFELNFCFVFFLKFHRLTGELSGLQRTNERINERKKRRIKLNEYCYSLFFSLCFATHSHNHTHSYTIHGYPHANKQKKQQQKRNNFYIRFWFDCIRMWSSSQLLHANK